MSDGLQPINSAICSGVRPFSTCCLRISRLVRLEPSRSVRRSSSTLSRRYCRNSGVRYRGYSSNAAENMMIPDHECGLGTFAVGIMLLTHPERLQNCNDLWINCSGDQFNNGDGRFDYVPYFIFHVSGVEFGMHEYNREHAHWGTASAAVWQSL